MKYTITIETNATDPECTAAYLLSLVLPELLCCAGASHLKHTTNRGVVELIGEYTSDHQVKCEHFPEPPF